MFVCNDFGTIVWLFDVKVLWICIDFLVIYLIFFGDGVEI